MNEKTKEALEIFKQVDFSYLELCCTKCPKIDKNKKNINCICCIDDAKDELLKYIENTKQKVEQYENLEDFNKKLLATKYRLDKSDKENQMAIHNAIELIKETKEYFHDGIDEELLDILEKRL